MSFIYHNPAPYARDFMVFPITFSHIANCSVFSYFSHFYVYAVALFACLTTWLSVPYLFRNLPLFAIPFISSATKSDDQLKGNASYLNKKLTGRFFKLCSFRFQCRG